MKHPQLPSIPDPENPNQRTPCILVVDCSGSMKSPVSGGATRIDLLNAGLRTFEKALRESEDALERVRLAIVCIGGAAGDRADVLMDWTEANDFHAFDLSAGGPTPLGEGLELALEMVDREKAVLRRNGISLTRPAIVVISDGAPTDTHDAWRRAIERCRTHERGRHSTIHPIGVEGVDTATLQEISAQNPVIIVDDYDYRQLFVVLSNSLRIVSRGDPDNTVMLRRDDFFQAQ